MDMKALEDSADDICKGKKKRDISLTIQSNALLKWRSLMTK